MWMLGIAFVILVFAIFLYSLGTEIVEDEHMFMGVVAVFLLVYIVAAAGMWMLAPRFGTSSISGIAQVLLPTP